VNHAVLITAILAIRIPAIPASVVSTRILMLKPVISHALPARRDVRHVRMATPARLAMMVSSRPMRISARSAMTNAPSAPKVPHHAPSVQLATLVKVALIVLKATTRKKTSVSQMVLLLLLVVLVVTSPYHPRALVLLNLAMLV